MFLRAQQELKAQAAKQSLAGETDSLRRSVEALLHRLTTEAERIDQQINEKLKLVPSNLDKTAVADFKITKSEDGRYAQVHALADAGETLEQIAKKTGMLPGEIELIIGLRPTIKVSDRPKEGDSSQ
ncbi:MAG: hypothetical protein WCO51_04465 [bacterium]